MSIDEIKKEIKDSSIIDLIPERNLGVNKLECLYLNIGLLVIG